LNHFVVDTLAIAVVLTASGLAQAQETAPDATGTPPAAEAAAPAEAPAPAPAAAAPVVDDTGGAVKDDVRFRFGVSGGIGFFTASDDFNSVSCTYYGLDLRFGAQINNMFAVYGEPAFGYYTTGENGALGAGGLFGFAAVGEVTIIDRFFAGAGIGYTIYNNPSGISPILRVGGYPLMSRSDVKARRKGLMLGIDLRFTPLEGLNTIVMPTFNLGYEAF